MWIPGLFVRAFGFVYLLPLALHAAWWLAIDPAPAWNQADWSSAGILPPARANPTALVHVYAARVGRWRGVFAHHTWIVVKEQNAAAYTRFDKTFWGQPVKVNGWAADARWFGNSPVLVGRVEGPAAQALIPRLRAAVARYPDNHPGDYRVWPGPNSNSFTAAILSAVPETGIALPPTAIGKDFRADRRLVGLSPSGTGVQLSLYGLLAVTIGWVEGIEIDVLGLVAGIDFRRPALKLPGFGRIGWPAA